jgi:hypothetical protein
MSIELQLADDERDIVVDLCNSLLLPVDDIDDIDVYMYNADDLARRILKAFGATK